MAMKLKNSRKTKDYTYVKALSITFALAYVKEYFSVNIFYTVKRKYLI